MGLAVFLAEAMLLDALALIRVHRSGGPRQPTSSEPQLELTNVQARTKAMAFPNDDHANNVAIYQLAKLASRMAYRFAELGISFAASSRFVPQKCKNLQDP